jgi:hypothetical protein
VKESVTEVLAIADTLRFRTVPGRVAVGVGGEATVSDALPIFPSLVAVI